MWKIETKRQHIEKGVIFIWGDDPLKQEQLSAVETVNRVRGQREKIIHVGKKFGHNTILKDSRVGRLDERKHTAHHHLIIGHDYMEVSRRYLWIYRDAMIDR